MTEVLFFNLSTNKFSKTIQDELTVCVLIVIKEKNILLKLTFRLIKEDV